MHAAAMSLASPLPVHSFLSPLMTHGEQQRSLKSWIRPWEEEKKEKKAPYRDIVNTIHRKKMRFFFLLLSIFARNRIAQARRACAYILHVRAREFTY